VIPEVLAAIECHGRVCHNNLGQIVMILSAGCRMQRLSARFNSEELKTLHSAASLPEQEKFSPMAQIAIFLSLLLLY